MAKYKNIGRVFDLVEKQVFTINQTLPFSRTVEAICLLCEVIESTETDEMLWNVGETSYCCLSEFIVGAYWFFAENHSGQYSLEYKALSLLGTIYTPNMETCDKENDAYLALSNYDKESY